MYHFTCSLPYILYQFHSICPNKLCDKDPICRIIVYADSFLGLGLTSLKEIDLSRCPKFNNAGVNHLLSIPNLEKLHISETRVTDDGFKLLSSLENLMSLDLGGLPVSDSAMNSLQVYHIPPYVASTIRTPIIFSFACSLVC